jgi:protein gp37
MGDLFHEFVFNWILRPEWECSHNPLHDIFKVMRDNPQHTFIILTKRPEWAKFFLVDVLQSNDLWPMDNVWLGVSAENQEHADKRIPILLDIPATVRFVSVEPMLEQIEIPIMVKCKNNYHMSLSSDLKSYRWDPKTRRRIPSHVCPSCKDNHFNHNKIDWVIIGAESGPGARKIDNSHILNLLLQCSDAHIPVFLKQAWINGKLVKMPNLGGQVWDMMPGVTE